MRKNNAYFVKHSGCPKCGSKDNLALYSDGGSHCFGCGWHPPVTRSPYVDQELNEQTEAKTAFPTFSHDLPQKGVEWAKSYGIEVQELLFRDVQGVEPLQFRQRMAFVFRDSTRVPILAQARNLEEGAKPKYITYGKPNEVLPIYYVRSSERRSNCLVLVEDCLSAIKVARLTDAMPCLASEVSSLKLKRLAGLYGAFLIWLDSDMYPKAQKMANKLQLLGCKAHAVYTDLDPKCYEMQDIEATLLTGFTNVV